MADRDLPTPPLRHLVPLLAFLFFGCLLIVAGCSRGAVKPISSKPQETDDPLEQGREALSKSRDLAVCRTALQYFNAYLSDPKTEVHSPAMSPELRALLQDPAIGLNADELAEVENSRFTLSDGTHLDLCFLIRDGLNTLELAENAPPAQKAAAAFAWVMRQVRLQDRDEELIPPQWILRKGVGTARERALIFLAALHQLGIDGCLLSMPSNKPGVRSLWTCGAVIGTEVFLFDPRLGLPLPGPDGKGVATLAAVRKAQPDLLTPLTVDEKHPYDVTADGARKAQVLLACPLSSMAPRMRLLEGELLGAQLTARLAQDPVAMKKRVQAAVGVETEVAFWLPAFRVARVFLLPEDGGIDNQARRQRFEYADFISEAVPPQLRELEGQMRENMTVMAAEPLVKFTYEPGKPRDQVLRGRCKDANLIVRLDEARDQAAKLRETKDIESKFAQWYGQFRASYVAFLEAEQAAKRSKDTRAQTALENATAQMNSVWSEGLPVLNTIIEGHSGTPRAAAVTYQIALCSHEDAVRYRTHGDARAAQAWKEAATWWESYLNDHPQRPEAPAARFFRAEALAMRGDRTAAAALLRDPPKLPELELVAWLYLAKQYQKNEGTGR